MILKFSGGILIVVSAVYSGFSVEAKGRKRIKEIENINKFIIKLKENTLNTLDSFNESVAKISKEMDFVTIKCFVALSNNVDITKFNDFSKEINDIPNQPLLESDIQILNDFVHMIDTRNLNTVISAMDKCNDKLEHIINCESKEFLSRCRLYRNMLIWAGILMTILLI